MTGLQRFPEGRRDARHEGRRAFDAHLLPEYGAHRELEGIDGAGNAEAALLAANRAFGAALSSQLEAQRARFERATDRSERQSLLTSMRSLRAERERVRAALPSSELPNLPAEGQPQTREEDPEDLLERADALRDAQDKLQKKVALLEVRISEVRDERELDRRMNDFLGEESLFDEQDRRIRLRKDATAKVTVDPQSPLGGGSAKAADSSETATAAGAPAGGATSNESFAGDPGSGSARAPSEPVDLAGTTTGSGFSRAQDSRPQVGAVRGSPILDPDLDDLGALEAELQRMRRVQGELGSRANELEKKAKSLE